MPQPTRHKLIVALDFVLFADPHSHIGTQVNHFEADNLNLIHRQLRFAKCKIIVIRIIGDLDFVLLNEDQTRMHKFRAEGESFGDAFLTENL